MTKRRTLLTLSLLGLTGLAAIAQQAKPQEQSAGKTLKIKLNYTGTAATVDDKHKIFVFLFDSPNFVQPDSGILPIASMSAKTKDETVTFSDLSASTVYAVATFDPKGDYDGMSGPPPSGSSIGIYSTEPGKPDAIKIDPAKAVQINLPFDDMIKMP